MRKLDTSSITDAAELPVKSGTLQFLQDAYSEMLAAIMQALLSPNYNPSTAYVVYGCVNAVAAPTYNISSGVIFWQGELYVVPAQNFAAAGGQVAILSVVISQYQGNGTNADPVLFTDNTPRNVHNIRKIQISAGTAGGAGTVNYVCDYTAVEYVSFVIPKQLNLTGIGAATVNGTYPNLEVDVPVNNNLHPCLDGGQITVGDVSGGGIPGNTFTVTLNNPQASGNYFVQGTLISEAASPQSDATVQWVVIDTSRTGTQFQVHFAELASATQSLRFEWMIFAK